MAKRKPEKPYKGILATPSPRINRRRAPEDNWSEYREIVAPKMDALFDHYKIDRNHPRKWEQLAFCLAWEHVPGFAPQRRQGRKVGQQTHGLDFQLFTACAYAERMNRSVNNTVRQLTRKYPFEGKNPGTLRDRYYLLKDGDSNEGKRLREFMDYLAEEAEADYAEERRAQREEEERREEEEE